MSLLTLHININGHRWATVLSSVTLSCSRSVRLWILWNVRREWFKFVLVLSPAHRLLPSALSAPQIRTLSVRLTLSVSFIKLKDTPLTDTWIHCDFSDIKRRFYKVTYYCNLPIYSSGLRVISYSKTIICKFFFFLHSKSNPSTFYICYNNKQ